MKLDQFWHTKSFENFDKKIYTDISANLNTSEIQDKAIILWDTTILNSMNEIHQCFSKITAFLPAVYNQKQSRQSAATAKSWRKELIIIFRVTDNFSVHLCEHVLKYGVGIWGRSLDSVKVTHTESKRVLLKEIFGALLFTLG